MLNRIVRYRKNIKCKKWLIFNWIVSVKCQYLKTFNYLQTNDSLYIELFVLNRNKWSHLYMCKKYYQPNEIRNHILNVSVLEGIGLK